VFSPSIDSYRLDAGVVSPSDFVPECRIFVDVDSDSVLDPGEQEVSEVGPLGLSEHAQLLVMAQIPQGVQGGDAAYISLNATSVSDTSSYDRENVVRVVARAEAAVSITLSADSSVVMPGGYVGYRIEFSNTGDRSARNVVVSDFIDYGGFIEGTSFVSSSAFATYPGVIEYYDGESGEWVDVEPSADRVKGVRLLIESLPPGAQGVLEFRVNVHEDREAGVILNSASVRYEGGDSQAYELSSNEVTVIVGEVSRVAIGPMGNPFADGTGSDCVVNRVNGEDSTYTFWHEIYNAGNFTDTFIVEITDSLELPPDWVVSFHDSSGATLSAGSYRCIMPPIPMGHSEVVGIRFTASPASFRSFSGTSMAIEVSAISKPHPESLDTVTDLFIRSDIPVISIRQSIRESTAMPGDVLSFMVTVKNITDELTVDSVVVHENLGTGMTFIDSDVKCMVSGNLVKWFLGSLAPQETKRIVLQAVVNAGQEWGKLSASAWAFGLAETGERVSDGPAVASVRIVDGVFTRRGTIFGCTFYDSDGDGMRDDGEQGVGSVSIFLEDGTQVVTDSLGKYSIPLVEEGTHVLRIDPSSLPDSLEVKTDGYYGPGEGGEFLLVLPPGGNRRVDFALVGKKAVDTGAVSLRDGAATRAVKFPEIEKRTAITMEAGGRQGRTPESKSGADLKNEKSIHLEEIARLSLWLMEHPGWRVLVEGHTDSIPIKNERFPSNLELSLARARSVYQMLLMNGIPGDRVDYTGCGSKKPVASNSTPEGRARNRRVEIKLIPPKGYKGSAPDLQIDRSVTESVPVPLSDSTGICADIVRPEEGHVFNSKNSIDIEVVVPLGSAVDLFVNNVPVGIERIGKKRINLRSMTETLVFYGVKIAEGKNDILVVCRHFGGDKSTCVRHVYLAGKPAMLVAEEKNVEVPADGKTAPELTFLVSDSNGLPVMDGAFATISGPDDLLKGLDENPDRNGVQVAIKNSRVSFSLPPSIESRREPIKVQVGSLVDHCEVRYVSPKKGIFMLGYGDMSFGYNNLKCSVDIHNTLRQYRKGLYLDGRVSMFGWGEVADGHYLTLAVDTKPVREDRLFNRINVDKGYPLYGDAGKVKYNAVSRSGTFVSLQSRNYRVAFGDFKTGFKSMELNRYDRAFNGLSWETEYRERLKVKGFVTKTDQITYQEEIPAEGTSGFYFLKHYPLVENSEKVRIEVRDRYQPEKIVKVDYKQVIRDYDINYLDGSILFKEPIPARDENLNPVYIVVSYECRTGTESAFVYGLRSEFMVTDSLRAGLLAVVEEEGVENSTIFGFDLSGKVSSAISLEGEFTHSEKFVLGNANAYRVAFKGVSPGRLRWSTYYRNIDKNFYNPSFSGGKTELGSRKVGLDLDFFLNREFSISSKSYFHRFIERSEKKGYADLVVSYAGRLIKGKMGVAGASHDDIRDGARNAMLFLASASSRRGRFKGEIQFDKVLTGTDLPEHTNRLQAEVSSRIFRNIYATAKHEYRTGASSGTRHLSQFGIESDRSKPLELYTRYRMEGSVSGERGMAIAGMKEKFRVNDDVLCTFTMEKQTTLSGQSLNDYFSIATGCSYIPSDRNYRVKYNYELRVESQRYKHLAGIAGMKKHSDRLSYLFKGELWFDDEKVEDNRVKGKAELAMALRPNGYDRLAVFSLLRSNYEKNSPAHPGCVDKELLFTVEANYSLSSSLQVEGKFAGRWLRKAFRSLVSDASTYLYQGEIIRVFGGVWDLRLRGRVVHQVESHSIALGSAIEVGHALTDAIWLGVGYDFARRSVEVSSINDYTVGGVFVRMRCKFTEKLMERFLREMVR